MSNARNLANLLNNSGDLTVDTNTLHVDAANNRVGVGTASPSGTLDLNISTNARGYFVDSIGEVGSGNFALQVINSTGSALKPFGIRAEDIRFATGSSERARVTDNGLTFNGDTAAANALDDYEEGTFTPRFTTNGGGESVTYDAQEGKYTKIGNRVAFTVFLGTDAFTGGSGTLRVDGFPFTFGSGDNTSGHIGLAYAFASTLDPAIWLAAGGTTRVDLYKQDNSANVWSTTVIASGTNSNRLYFSGHYRTTA